MPRGRLIGRLLAICLLPPAMACSALTGQDDSDNLLEGFDEIAPLTAAASASRCVVNNSSAGDPFTSGSTPTGTSVAVTRESLTSGPGGLPADLYYPAATNNDPLPMVVLLQGGNVNAFFYSRYAARVAAEGFAVLVPDVCKLFFFQYFLFPGVEQVTDGLAYLKSLNSAASSALNGRLDTTRLGLLGHSLGSVAGLYALRNSCQFPFCLGTYSRPSELKAGIFYGASLPAGSTFTADGIAAGFLQGSTDTAVTPDESRVTYNESPAVKAYVTITGANHYGLTDVAAPEEANPDNGAQTLARETSIETIGRWSAVFLKAYVQGDSTSLTTMASGGSADSNATVELQN